MPEEPQATIGGDFMAWALWSEEKQAFAGPAFGHRLSRALAGAVLYLSEDRALEAAKKRKKDVEFQVVPIVAFMPHPAPPGE